MILCSSGFIAYLSHYPYSCTEQLVSQAMPAIVLSQRPEFGLVQAQAGVNLAGLIDELRARQNPDGAYRYWPGGFETQEFVSVYAQHVLLEAGERAQAVPRDLMNQGNEYLRMLAARDGNSLEQERNGAYALYLLTRQGQTMGAEASRLRERLETRYKNQWRGDLATAYLASAMHLMKQQREAENLFAKFDWKGERSSDGWHDPMTADAERLYLTAKHFPDRLEKLPADFVDRIVARITNGSYHSLSAATTLLALDAYAAVAVVQAPGQLSIAELLANKQARALMTPDDLFPKADFGADATALRFGNQTGLPAFSVVSQSGFDRDPPKDAVRTGFEILREYTNSHGKPVTAVRQGEEITVHLRFRSLSKDQFSNVALVDLLPGGFELVVPSAAAETQIGQASTSEVPNGESAIEEGRSDGGNPSWTCAICQTGTTARIDYADFREDRNVFYVRLNPEVQQVVYRIKATNLGTFTVPPAFGEGMYRRDITARSVAASITVNAP